MPPSTEARIREDWKIEVAKKYAILQGFVIAQNNIADYFLSILTIEIESAKKEERYRLSVMVSIAREPTPSAYDHKEYNRGIRKGAEMIRNAVLEIINKKP